MIKTMIFDIGFIRRYILDSHRLPEEEIEQIVIFSYLEYLKHELYRSNYIFRYQGTEIDEDIWYHYPIRSFEMELASEIYHQFHGSYTHQFECISNTKDTLTNVVHFHQFLLRGSLIFIEYQWE